MLYLPGRFIALQGHETMRELGVSSLTHFHLCLCIPGGGKINFYYTTKYSHLHLLLLASTSSDQCALNEDGSLKDASEIQFYHDVDSVAPLNASSSNASAGMYTLS